MALTQPCYSLAPMAKFNVSRDDPLDDLYTLFAEQMGGSHQNTCKNIAAELKEEHGAITIGCMEEVWYHEVEKITLEKGGKAGWLRSLQHLIGFKFKNIDDDQQRNAPPSAVLAHGQSFGKE